MVIAVAGSGGKTTRIHKLRDQWLSQGKTVFVGTTTHMKIEKETILDPSIEEIKEQLEKKNYCIAGTSIAGTQKIGPLPDEILKQAADFADAALIEADGSRGLPVKYPDSYEPVIPDFADEIQIVTGLSALGRTCREAAHRKDLVLQCLGIKEDDILEPVHLQRLVTEGYVNPLRRRHPSARVRVCPGQVNTLYEKVIARFLQEEKDVSLIQKEWFSSQPKLIIFGAGHVARQLLKLAGFLDFYTIVLDDREEFANREKLPEADEVYCCDFQKAEEYLPEGDQHYYVVVTRGHAGDEICVKKVLARSYAYLGMIGSRKKVKAAFESLEAQGFSKEAVEGIHAPIGLAIGARTPEEIAVSIAAELIQIKNQGTVSTMTKELLETQENGVLCIIIKKSGSSPRGVGSMMLVCKDKVIGSIGGGALENEVIRTAPQISQITVRDFSLSNEESANLGMICGGTNQILFVPICQ